MHKPFRHAENRQRELKEGKTADITIFNAEEKYTIDITKFVSKTIIRLFTAFLYTESNGDNCRGRIVVKDGKLNI